MSKRQLVEELHKPARKHFKRRKVVIKSFDDCWQCDLVDMSAYSDQNKGFKFLLTIIDTFSKYAWAIPIKDKSGISVKNALQNLLNALNVPANVRFEIPRTKDLVKNQKYRILDFFVMITKYGTDRDRLRISSCFTLRTTCLYSSAKPNSTFNGTYKLK